MQKETQVNCVGELKMTFELLGIPWQYILLGIGLCIGLYFVYRLLKIAIKWAVIIGVLAWLVIYILNNYDVQQIAIGIFLIVAVVGVVGAVLALSGRKGDVRDLGYQFEMGKKIAEDGYKRSREGKFGGVI